MQTRADMHESELDAALPAARPDLSTPGPSGYKMTVLEFLTFW
jgi:hypothetical protein